MFKVIGRPRGSSLMCRGTYRNPAILRFIKAKLKQLASRAKFKALFVFVDLLSYL